MAYFPPYLYAIYVDDLINVLRGSGLGIHIGSVFVGSIFYADDILVNAYCLSALLYGAESWSANEAGIHKASVAWNNSFRHNYFPWLLA